MTRENSLFKRSHVKERFKNNDMFNELEKIRLICIQRNQMCYSMRKEIYLHTSLSKIKWSVSSELENNFKSLVTFSHYLIARQKNCRENYHGHFDNFTFLNFWCYIVKIYISSKYPNFYDITLSIFKYEIFKGTVLKVWSWIVMLLL